MAFNPNAEQTSFEREIVPAGVHAARVARIIEIGEQHSPRFDKHDEETGELIKSIADKVIISFSLPNVVRNFGDEIGDKQSFIGNNWGIKKSVDLKSTMKKYTKAIDPNGECKDYSEWLGRPCQVSVQHTSREDKTFANLDSVAPIMPGYPLDELDTEPFFFEWDNPDPELWPKIPEFIQERIKDAVNYPGSKVEAMVNELEGLQEPDVPM